MTVATEFNVPITNTCSQRAGRAMRNYSHTIWIEVLSVKYGCVSEPEISSLRIDLAVFDCSFFSDTYYTNTKKVMLLTSISYFEH
jgi:hypothetical protein